MALGGTGGGSGYEFSGDATIGIWAKKGGVWSRVATEYVSVYDYDGTTGTARNLAFQMSNTFQLGTGVQSVGISIEAFTGMSAALTAFNNLRWQAAGAASTNRSATPNGEKSIVTVRP